MIGSDHSGRPAQAMPSIVSAARADDSLQLPSTDRAAPKADRAEFVEALPQFLRLRADEKIWSSYGRATEAPDEPSFKRPLQPNGANASTTDPTTWAALPTLLPQVCTGVFEGVGVQIGGLPPNIVAFDLDGALDEAGAPEPWARGLPGLRGGEAFYVERSRSRRGVHFFAELPPDAVRPFSRGPIRPPRFIRTGSPNAEEVALPKKAAVEHWVGGDPRFLIITGDRYA